VRKALTPALSSDQYQTTSYMLHRLLDFSFNDGAADLGLENLSYEGGTGKKKDRTSL
jgi:hypothetical protein